MKKIRPFKITRRVFGYPYVLFMMLFIILPLVLILVNAFLDPDGYLTLENFKTFFTERSSLIVLGNSVLVGIITTLICLLIGYPVAYILSKYSSGKILVILFILPMWVNFLIRTLATKAVFLAMGIELGMGTVIFGMVYNYLPFMILPLHTTISSIDKSYIEAAQDLGADKSTVFLKTVLPLSTSGIISGITMVFIPTISTYAISQLLSNGTIFLFGDSIQMKFEQGLYGVGSIMSIVMLIFVLISNFLINKFSNNTQRRTLL
ncbi:MAG: ABC transporter permease [Acidaminococcus sp.]|nr:ABC transporter permease [Acidaminococcus sp.]MDY5345443.1 ABC transporter permease [Eubacteriales bacterium]